VEFDGTWTETAANFIEKYAKRTPGAFMEVKETSVAF